METITTRKFNKAEEEAFKLGYDASLPNVRALVKEVKRQDAVIQQLRAIKNNQYRADHKREKK